MNAPEKVWIPNFYLMQYAKPEYPVEAVNRAAKALANIEISNLDENLTIIDNWRASHAYPAQSFYVTLKRRACKIYSDAQCAQRIKRLPSILFKLQREKEMKLSQMQDIGGCRAVLKNVSQVRALESEIEKFRWKHKRIPPKDYIAFPKPSGYRGVHLKYKYQGGGIKAAYNGLKIELQLRTDLQHKWATAVEAADTFTRQALKSNRGNPEWQRFFALMGSVFAIQEKSPLVPGTPQSLDEIVEEIKNIDRSNHIATMFSAYATVLPRVENRKDATYFLVTLDPIVRNVKIRGFKRGESQLANAEYTAAEKALGSDSPTQVVLVSVSSIAALKRVYPNYFLDTKAFLSDVQRLIN